MASAKIESVARAVDDSRCHEGQYIDLADLIRRLERAGWRYDRR